MELLAAEFLKLFGLVRKPDKESSEWVHEFVVNTIMNWQLMGLKPEVYESYMKEVKKLIENKAKEFY